METALFIGKILLVLFQISIIILILITEWENRAFIWTIWKRFQIKMFFECVGIILLTLFCLILLSKIPILNWGWFNIFNNGNPGNILITPIQEFSHSSKISVRLAVLLFFIVLMLLLPLLAYREEEMFRKGHIKLSTVIRQSIKFGLVHCLVGVPLFIGIGLIVPGLFYGLKYKNTYTKKILNFQHAQYEAVMTSTTYHTMYNTIILIPLLFFIIKKI